MNYSDVNLMPKRASKVSKLSRRFEGRFSEKRNYHSTECLCDVPPSIDPTWLDYNIRKHGSHIYFYDEINPETQLILISLVRDAVRDVLTEHVGELLGGELPESVTIHVNSPGGYMSCGFALYDYIKTSQVPITCVVEGLCASAATLIMLACPNRVMSPNSVFLAHQCSWGAWGENRFMQDNARNANRSMERLRKIYMDETTVGSSETKNDAEREAFIQHWLEHDYELSSEDCEGYGIVNSHSDDDDDVELSEERVEKLQEYVKKLAAEQKKENAKKAAEEKAKAEEEKDQKSIKKAQKKSVASHEEDTKKSKEAKSEKKEEGDEEIKTKKPRKSSKKSEDTDTKEVDSESKDN